MEPIFILGLLACPLGMVAMGGAVWVINRTMRRDSAGRAKRRESA